MVVSVRVDLPADGDERSIALGWLAFHRDALLAKCRDLTPDRLATRSAHPSQLSLLGLVRHLAEMERSYGSWPLGDQEELVWVWGTYEVGVEEDFDCSPADVDQSFEAWKSEQAKTDLALDAAPDLGAMTKSTRSVRWNLAKLIGEYARHNGQADIIRERIDGATGE